MNVDSRGQGLSQASDRTEPASDAAAGGGVYFLGDAHLGAESRPSEVRKERELCDLLRYLRGRASTGWPAPN